MTTPDPIDFLYDVNGLRFWSEREIVLREAVVASVLHAIRENLTTQNPAFRLVRVEAPLLTPRTHIAPGYTDHDVFATARDLVLRPETTAGSYEAARAMLNPHFRPKTRPPLVVWQHGKSFRQEQDQPTKFMRFKEFYQLEFQIIYSETTQADYAADVIPAIHRVLVGWVGPCRVEPSDRIPHYSDGTTDVVREANGMEVCSISRRTDFQGHKVLEVAVGSDRVVLNHLLHTEEAP